MNLKIIGESLKFYKIKSSSAIKVMLVLLIGIRAFMTMAPIGDRNFDFINDLLNADVIQSIDIYMPTRGNLIIIGVYLIGYFLCFCLGMLYAQIFILENQSYRSNKINLGQDTIFMIPLNRTQVPLDASQESITEYIKSSIRPSSFKREIKRNNENQLMYVKTALLDLIKGIPQLVLYLLLILLVMVFSAPLFMLPFLVITLMTFFAPLNILYSQNKFSRSIELSYRQTNGAKITVLFTYTMQSFLFNIVSNFLMVALENYYYGYLVIEAFVFAVEILVIARLYALFYQILALRQPYNV